MKFSPGDPVWARSSGRDLKIQPPAAEYPATVLEQEDLEWYRIEILSYINPFTNDHVFWCNGKFMRPRRDDYQQHEPLSSRTDLNRILSTPQPAQEWTKETAVSGY